jgi:putative DNA methylase
MPVLLAKHVVVEPGAKNPLDRIVHSWKSYTAHQANRVLDRNGGHRDYFNRYIRDEGHLSRTIDYVAIPAVESPG